MRMCHCAAKRSGSSTPAAVASSQTNARMFARCTTHAWRTGSSRSSNSSSDVTNAQPSKSSRVEPLREDLEDRQQLRAGVVARPRTSACTQPFVQRSSRSARNASARSFLEAKLRYSVIFATSASAVMVSTPIARTPDAAEELVGGVEDALAATAATCRAAGASLAAMCATIGRRAQMSPNRACDTAASARRGAGRKFGPHRARSYAPCRCRRWSSTASASTWSASSRSCC